MGSEVPVSYADGAAETLRVAAVYESDDMIGDVVVSNETWAPHAIQQDDVAVIIELAGGVAVGDGERAVQAVADSYFGPDVQTRQEYIQSVTSQIDQMLAVVYVLLVLAILIALMGIANTLSLSIHERTRELGLLRAVGQSRRQMRSMVRGESVVVALFGTIGGLGLGSFLGWALVASLEDDGGSSFSLPLGQLVMVMAVGALVGVVAAIRPARRAARLDILGAIAAE